MGSEELYQQSGNQRLEEAVVVKPDVNSYSFSMYIYICVCVCVCVYIYIYVYIYKYCYCCYSVAKCPTLCDPMH